jgi:hypothetical protein
MSPAPSDVTGRQGPPAIAEQYGDGWRITIAGRELGVVRSRQAAEQLVEKLDVGQRQKARQ